jgi:membrane AbrB-like protein
MYAWPQLPKSAEVTVAVIATLAAGLAGGTIAWFLHFPLPWLLGSLATTAALGLSGVKVRTVYGGRSAGQVVVGCATGVQFTAAVFAKLGALLPLLIGAALVSTMVGLVAAIILMRLTGLDRATAFFATAPGGVIETVNVAARYGAPLEPIMVAQTMRVTMIVVLAPFLVRHFHEGGAFGTVAAVPTVPWVPMMILLAISTAVGMAFAALRSPSAWLMGPLVVGATAGGLGLVEGRAPDLVLIVAQVFIGIAIGSQFRREFLTRLWRYLIGSIVAVSFAAAVLAAFATGIALWLGYPVATMVLATAPAGIAEMVLTGKLLGLDATLIAGFQLVRIIFVLLWCRAALRLLQRFG